jgi:hypothetical protein
MAASESQVLCRNLCDSYLLMSVCHSNSLPPSLCTSSLKMAIELPKEYYV